MPRKSNPLQSSAFQHCIWAPGGRHSGWNIHHDLDLELAQREACRTSEGESLSPVLFSLRCWKVGKQCKGPRHDHMIPPVQTRIISLSFMRWEDLNHPCGKDVFKMFWQVRGCWFCPYQVTDYFSPPFFSLSLPQAFNRNSLYKYDDATYVWK